MSDNKSKRRSTQGGSMYKLSPYIRVLKLATQPTWEEFSRIALITGLGSVLVGLLGFTIFLVMNALPA